MSPVKWPPYPLLAIDPGPEESAFVLIDGGRVCAHGKYQNPAVLGAIMRERVPEPVLVIETFQPRGQPLYAQLIDTARWTGRFEEAARSRGYAVRFVVREAVKRHILGTNKGSDANVRAAIIDRFGGKAEAIGSKAHPGPLYGIKADVWQALALAITYAETI